MKTTLGLAAVTLLAVSAQLASAAPAADQGAGPAKAVPPPESDMSYTGKTDSGESVTVPMNLLGGLVGNHTVNGVRVELYVLLPQDPGRLKPGDPNHAFTVTLKDEKSGAFLRRGEVSLAAAGGAGAAQRSVMAMESDGIFRSAVTLPQPGDYRLTVGFKTAGRSGLAEFPYVFVPADQTIKAHHH
jgi:hypothetical protein